ncbi:hypothetical protein [Nocardia sp. NPDC004722]
MRRMLRDALWVLLGVMVGIAIMVGSAYWALIKLSNEVFGDPKWDGTLQFIADCPVGSACRVTSLPDQTPSLAVKGKPGGTVSLAPVPTIAGLQTGDHVSCTLHVEVWTWGQSYNDPEPQNTLENCHRT